MTFTLGLLWLILNVIIQISRTFSIIKIAIINFIICQIHLKLWICNCTHASQKWTESFIQNFSCTIYMGVQMQEKALNCENRIYINLWVRSTRAYFAGLCLRGTRSSQKKSCAGLFIWQIIWGWSVWDIWTVLLYATFGSGKKSC